MNRCPKLTSRPSLLGATIVIALSASVALAQNPSSGSTTREGVHVVRPGDSLELLAQQYLGSAQLWRDIWERNPDIKNPHLLKPGAKVLLPFRRLPDDSAFVAKISNRVLQWRPPLKQEPATTFDVLRARDQLETGKRSSAEIAFPDLSVLRLNEESKVVLEPPVRQGTTVERDQVQLVTGQVDLEGSDLAADAGIQLVMGPATATPQASEDGSVRARARIEGDAAQLMAYTGSSELQAGGATVAVEQGMGSTAKEGEAPTPPEKLLDAPGLDRPEADARLATPRPRFSWQPVDGARDYTLEICLDADCGRLERRILKLADTSWQPEEALPVTDLYWRVTAVSPSGLDGYPAGGRPLAVTSDQEDVEPPSVAFKVDGVHMAPRYGLNRQWILGPGALFEALADDAESGLDRWIPLRDGEEISPQSWSAGPWETGVEHEASFVALDRAGNQAVLEPVPFIFDDQAPTLTWGLEGIGPQGTVAPPETTLDGLPWHPSRQTLKVNDPHSWWPWRKQIWTVDRDPRQILLRPNRPVRVRIDGGQEVILGPEQGLWILAEDAICEMIHRFDYRSTLTVEGSLFDKSSVLDIGIEARDPLNNGVQGHLRLETLGKAD